MSRRSYLRYMIRGFFVNRKVAKVKKVVIGNSYPPLFDYEKWCEGKKGCNCYAYALDIPVRDGSKQFWNPGVISGNNPSGKSYSVFNLIENIKADIETLGFSYRKDECTLHDGEYRIAIYHIPTYHYMSVSFHMVRQDEDGRWSEKPSWNSKVNRFKEISVTPPDLSKYDAYLCETLIIKKVSN